LVVLNPTNRLGRKEPDNDHRGRKRPGISRLFSGWSGLPDAEISPKKILAVESGPGFESQKVHEFLTAALQFNPPLRVELSKPWSVPSWRDNGMAEIA
jgi:hypothetical protein